MTTTHSYKTALVFAFVALSAFAGASCGNNPFNPTVGGDAIIVIRNRSVADTVTSVLLGQCDVVQLNNELGVGGLVLPNTDRMFNVAGGCHRAVLLERTDTIAQRAQVRVQAGDTAIVVLQPRG